MARKMYIKVVESMMTYMYTISFSIEEIEFNVLEYHYIGNNNKINYFYERFVFVRVFKCFIFYTCSSQSDVTRNSRY